MTTPDTTLPEPMVPAEVDLRDFSWMPIEIHRLRRSKAWLICKRRPELAFYMINLWTAAWHDTPAGSLEDDDDVLADLAMCDPSKWDKVREHVLRGWVKATDGRLYHPVVAEKAAEAWTQKQAQRQRTEAARQARQQRQQQAQSQGSKPTTTDNVTKPVAVSVTEHVTASNGTEQTGPDRRGTGEGTDIPSEAVASAAAAAPPTDRDLVFANGVVLLTAAGVTDRNARSFLAAQCKAHGEAAVRQALERCAEERAIDPVSWLQAALKVAAGKRGQPNRQQAIEDENHRVAAAWAAGATP